MLLTVAKAHKLPAAPICKVIKVMARDSGRRPPDGVSSLFHQLSTKRSPRVAKLLIWLLGRVHETPAGGSEEQDVVLLGLERLGGLLEQYYHPSNNGK